MMRVMMRRVMLVRVMLRRVMQMRVMLVMSMSMASMIIVISLKGKRTTVRDLEAHHPSLQSGFHRSPLGHKIQKLIYGFGLFVIRNGAGGREGPVTDSHGYALNQTLL